MHRTWKLIGLNTMLAAAFAVPPAFAQTDGTTDRQRLEKIQATLDEMKKEITDLKSQIGTINTGLKNFENLQAKTGVGGESLQGPLNELKDIVAKLKMDVQAIHDKMQLPGGSSVSGFRPADAAVQGQTAKVRVVNKYAAEVKVVINGVVYTFMPGEEQTRKVPAGYFTYELLGPNQKRVTQWADPNTTFRLDVLPGL